MIPATPAHPAHSHSLSYPMRLLLRLTCVRKCMRARASLMRIMASSWRGVAAMRPLCGSSSKAGSNWVRPSHQMFVVVQALVRSCRLQPVLCGLLARCACRCLLLLCCCVFFSLLPAQVTDWAGQEQLLHVLQTDGPQLCSAVLGSRASCLGQQGQLSCDAAAVRVRPTFSLLHCLLRSL
jgi:hypothetical protein